LLVLPWSLTSLPAERQPAQERVRFNVRPGTVYGDLRREEIYDDER
jgi:hypothetical protein